MDDYRNEDYRNDEIIYEEDWQTVTDNVQKTCSNDSDAPNNEPAVEPTEKKHKPIAIITIQLIICLAVAFVIFMLRSMNSDTYHKLCDWYDDNMSKTLISQETFDSIDLSEYFTYFTDNGDKASPDEI